MLAMMSINPVEHAAEFRTNQVSSELHDEANESGGSFEQVLQSEYRWYDLESEMYKGELMRLLDEQGHQEYSHLSDIQFAEVKGLVCEHRTEFMLDDTEPSLIKGYLFDIELEEGCKPVRAQLPKLSPDQLRKEAHHLDKPEKSAASLCANG